MKKKCLKHDELVLKTSLLWPGNMRSACIYYHLPVNFSLVQTYLKNPIIRAVFWTKWNNKITHFKYASKAIYPTDNIIVWAFYFFIFFCYNIATTENLCERSFMCCDSDLDHICFNIRIVVRNCVKVMNISHYCTLRAFFETNVRFEPVKII